MSDIQNILLSPSCRVSSVARLSSMMAGLEVEARSINEEYVGCGEDNVVFMRSITTLTCLTLPNVTWRGEGPRTWLPPLSSCVR